MNDKRSARLEWVALGALTVFTALSTAGYATFALHPENLPQTGFALTVYNVSFEFFAQLHILFAFSALALVLIRRTGTAWVAGLAAVYVLSFTSEHLGTGYGIPFGGYAYTGLLGPRLGSRVPALIPLSWFLMAMPAWIIARSIAPGRTVPRIVLGSLGLVLWDLALDPAMSALTPYWRWSESGPYYGMPWMNLFGWFVTGLVLMFALERLVPSRAAEALPVRWMALFYTLVVLLPLGMLAAAAEWLAVGTTFGAYAVLATAVVGLRARSSAADRDRRVVGDDRRAAQGEVLPVEAS